METNSSLSIACLTLQYIFAGVCIPVVSFLLRIILEGFYSLISIPSLICTKKVNGTHVECDSWYYDSAKDSAHAYKDTITYTYYTIIIFMCVAYAYKLFLFVYLLNAIRRQRNANRCYQENAGESLLAQMNQLNKGF